MNWPSVPFDEIIADSAFGPRFSADCYDNAGNVATLRTTDLSPDGFISLDTMPHARIDEDKFENHFLKVGDLVISRSGRIGTTAIFNGYHKPVLPGAFLIRFRLDMEKAYPLFFRFFFNSIEGQQRLLSVAQGAAQQNINITNVRKISIPLPPLLEQRQIAYVLASYDDLVATNKRRIALLGDAARRLYREWFVHLRFPGHESVPVKNGVPEGWEKLPLGDLAEITMGQSPESRFYNTDGEGLPFHQGVSDFGHRFVTHETFTKQATRIAEAGDILCSVRAPVGRLNLTRDKIAIGRGLSAMRSRVGHQSLLFYQLDTLFVEEDMIGGGAIFASVGKKELFGQLILQPTPSIAAVFNLLVSNIDEQINTLDSQNRGLAEARNLLLTKLMSGQLDVSGIHLSEEESL